MSESHNVWLGHVDVLPDHPGEWLCSNAVLHIVRQGRLEDAPLLVSVRIVSGVWKFDLRLTAEQAEDIGAQLIGVSRALEYETPVEDREGTD